MSNPAANRHVLFITGEYPPLTGGVGAYTQRLAHALVDLGWQASVWTTAQVPKQMEDSPVRIYPHVERWDWHIWREAPRIARELDAGWLHVQYQTAAYGMNPAINFAVNGWRRSGMRVAWTYHDLLPPYLFPKAGRRLRSAVTTRPARLADLTVVTNEGDRLQLDSVARNLVRIPIGSNIPSLAVTAEERAVLRTQFGYTDDDFVVGYFGFLNRTKGGLTLVRTLSRLQQSLPNVRLLMIGERVGASDPTNYAYLQEVEALIEELGLATSVQWTGHLSGEAVGQMLATTDALLMPYEDGASLRRGTLMAGLGQGCAVVTTRPQAPIPELVQERDLLYVPAGDAEAATEAILRIAREPGLARTLREGARESSRQFTWQAIARQHVTCYESIDD